MIDTNKQNSTQKNLLFGEIPAESIYDNEGELTETVAKFETLNLASVFDITGTSLGELQGFSLSDSTVAYSGETISITGKLGLDYDFLKPIKEYLPKDILIGAELNTKSDVFSGKINIDNFKFYTTVPFSYKITDNFGIVGATLCIDVFPFYTIDWEKSSCKLVPSITGIFEIFNLAKEAVIFSATIFFEDDCVILNAHCFGAKDLLGIDWLDLDYLNARLQLGSSNEIALSANFNVENTRIILCGKFNESNCELSGAAENFTLSDLSNLFNKLSGQNLDAPDFDLLFENVSVKVSTETGLTLHAKVRVHEFECESTIHISSDGVEFSGAMGNLKIGSVEILNAQLILNLYGSKSGKQNEFKIAGVSKFEGIELACIAQSQSGEYAVAAAVDTNKFELATVFPVIKSTFINDLRFNKLGFAYATKELDGIKQGLSLLGELAPITKLSVIGLGSQTLDFGVTFGLTPQFALSVKDCKLDLGNRIECDPIQIAVNLSPVEFALIFGMKVIMDSQDPLRFDLRLVASETDASGSATMVGTWINPFGITGLTVADVALELGINYATFAASHTPTVFGLAGKVAIGNTKLEVAVKVSENPKDELLAGHIQNLTTRDLFNFVSMLTTLDIPVDKIPNFFTINDFLLYVAPNGGTIGMLTYEKGVSFKADLIMFGEHSVSYASVSNDGLKIGGTLEKLDFGILKIGGKNGGELTFDAEITNKNQAFKFDGEIVFLGAKVGLFADVSNKGVEFSFEQSFLDMLKFEVNGKSSGSFNDLANFDFALTASFKNDLLDYISKNVVAKIDEAIKVVNLSIDEAEKEVNRAKEAYRKLYEPAYAELERAKKEADEYLKKCSSDVEKAKEDWKKDIEKAKSEVARTKQAYDNAFNKAKSEVARTQKEYEKDVDDARRKVEKAQNDYNSALNNARAAVDKAQRDYDRSFGTAQAKLNSAQREVDSLNRQIEDYKYKIKHAGWRDFYRVPDWSITLGGLYTAYGAATGTLQFCKGIVEGFRYASEYTVLESAKLALKGVQTTGEYAAFESSKATLEYVAKRGISCIAFDSAKATLNGIQKTSEYTVWKAAESTLSAVETTGNAALNTAQFTLNNIATSVVYLAVKTAELSIIAVQKSSEAVAFDTAKLVLETARFGSEAVLLAGKYILKASGELLNIREITLSSSLKKIESGDLFKAYIKARSFGCDFDATIDFNIAKPFNFLEDVFKEAFGEIKKLAIAH
jgi:phage shock protein A